MAACQPTPPKSSADGGDAPESAEDGEAALYRLLFALAGTLYALWWLVNRYTTHVEIDPLWERLAVSALASCGYFLTLHPRLRRYSPWVAELVIYTITIHYFALVVRNGFSNTLQVGLFITLTSIGLVPRALPHVVIYAVVASALAALSCWVGQVSGGVCALVMGGVATLQTVGLGIALRLSRVTAARAQAERALLAAKETAERALAAKGEFLAKVSHELRTPMNGVINMVELARDSRLTPTQDEYLETASACARDMLVIVNDLLDLSKVEAGRMTLQPVHFSLAELLERALKELVLRAATKGLDMRVMVRPDVPDRLYGDGLRLQQVLVNLIGNAVKFTERGAIEVEVATRPGLDDQAKVSLSFRVSDTGPGIAAESLERIFIAFEQGDGSISRRYGGTGLGLNVSSELVGLMGGRLEVSSTLGVGSTFRFELAFERSSLEHNGERRVLQRRIHEGRIHEGRIHEGRIHDGRADERRVEERLHEPASGPAPAPSPRLHAPLDVLLAEDNLVNTKIVAELLERAGHRVFAVADGAAALTALAERDFDVVLLDVQMPLLDGLQVAQQVRAGAVPGKERTALVAITAQAIAGDRERFLAAGIDAYLAKPIEREQLIATVERMAAQAPPRAAPASAAIDEAELRRRTGDDEGLLTTVLAAYHQEGQALLGSITQAAAARDAQALQHCAHNLKGALLTLGAKDAAHAAAALEGVGASGAWETQERKLAALATELSRVDAFIAERFHHLLEAHQRSGERAP